MSVIAGSVGIHGKFVQKLKDHQARTNAGEEVAEDSPEPAGSRKHPHDFSIDQADFIQILSLQLRQLFNAAIAVNLTAFEDADPETSKVVFIGNKSETALLKFAKDLGWANYKKTRDVASGQYRPDDPFLQWVEDHGRRRQAWRWAMEIVSQRHQ